jgi:hypothetical protein
MHKINEECYSFKEINYDNGLLDEIIDCTYVIHLEGNNRIEQVYTQLNKYNLSKKILILFNKGFKKCNKNIKNTGTDLIESNFYIFEHAKNNDYNNILILEDDFLLDEKIKNKKNINNIKNFFNKNKNKNKSFIYSLGCIPLLSIPLYYDAYTWYSPYALTTHAVIHTKKFREKLLNIGLDKIIEKDMGWDCNLLSNSYFYYKILVYQTLEDTDNRKRWSVPILNRLMHNLKLDVQPKFGFRLVNYLSKVLFIFILLLFIFISYKIIIKIHKYYNQRV